MLFVALKIDNKETKIRLNLALFYSLSLLEEWKTMDFVICRAAKHL